MLDLCRGKMERCPAIIVAHIHVVAQELKIENSAPVFENKTIENTRKWWETSTWMNVMVIETEEKWWGATLCLARSDRSPAAAEEEW